MKNDWLDKELKNKLDQHASPLNTMAAWNQLAERRQSRRRKKRVVWLFWMTGIALLIGLSSGLYVATQPSMAELKKESHLAKEQRVSNSTNNLTTSKTLKKESNKKEENSQAVVSPPSSQQQQQQQQQTQTTTNKTVRTTTSLNTSNTKSGLKTQLLSQSPAAESKEIATQKQVLAQADEQSKKASKVQTNSVNTKTIAQPIEERSLLTAFASLPLHEEKLISKEKNISPHPVRFAAKNKKWWFGLLAGYENKWQQFRIENGVDRDLVNRRDGAERGLDGWWAGLQVRRELSSNWFVESGLQYQQTTNELTDQYLSNYNQPEDNLILQIVERLDGTREEIRGMGEVLITEDSKRTIYNQSSSISLPFYLGYQVNKSQRLAVNLLAGAEFNIQTTYTGRTFEDANGLGTYVNLSDLPYRRSFWQAAARLEGQYSLSPELRLTLGLNGRFDLQNRLKQTATYQERAQRIGLLIGLAKKF